MFWECAEQMLTFQKTNLSFALLIRIIPLYGWLIALSPSQRQVAIGLLLINNFQIALEFPQKSRR